MSPATGTALRLPRAFVLAGVAAVAGVAGHAYAGGLLPSPVTLALIFGACVLGVAALLGGPASTLRVVLLTVGGQTFVHLALTLTAGHHGDPGASTPQHGPRPTQDPAPLATPSATGGRRTGSLFDQYAAGAPGGAEPSGTDLAVPAGLQHVVADLTGAHAPMVVVHLLAAAVVGCWLAVGEHALWALVALATAVAVPRPVLLLGALASLPARWRPSAARNARPLSPPRLVVLARCVVRRGPPVLLAG